MRLIEPCCYHKQLDELVAHCTDKQTSVHFFSYSDWDLSDLLNVLSGYTRGGEIHLALVRLDVKTISSLRKVLSRVYPDPSQPQNHLAAVSKMVLITQPSASDATFNQRAELREQLGRFIQEGRLTVCEDTIGFRCIAVKTDSKTLVIQGSINSEKSGAMQMFTLTGSKKEYGEVEEMFQMKARTKKLFKTLKKSQNP